MSYLPGLSYGWWCTPTPSFFFEALTERLPLLFLHNLLAGLEARIVARLVDYYGDEEGRQIWDTTTNEERDVRIRCAVDDAMLKNWSTLFAHVAQRDQAELKRLMEGAR